MRLQNCRLIFGNQNLPREPDRANAFKKVHLKNVAYGSVYIRGNLSPSGEKIKLIDIFSIDIQALTGY